MQRRNANLFKIGGAVALLVPALALADPQVPPSAPVTVVNQTANPVPVTGTLGISGGVTVSNSSSNPVPVTGTLGISGTVATKNMEDPGRSPFSARLHVTNVITSCQTLGGGYQACDFKGGYPVVPAGKRLVITDFSGQAMAPQGCLLVEISLSTNNEGGGDFGSPITYAIPYQSAAIKELFNFHERMLAFVDSGSSPFLTVTASCAGLEVGQQVATISGYFVSVP